MDEVSKSEDRRKSRPLIHQLSIKDAFESLSQREKLYAHHMSRAAWQGTRIILRQVSPEASAIFDFIIELYTVCKGSWQLYVDKYGVDLIELESFLDYASVFLSNVGNYYGSGDQKFTPDVSPDFLIKLAGASEKLKELHDEIALPMMKMPPFSLGFPGAQAQSAYYPSSHDGTSLIDKHQISILSRALERRSIYPENTRIRKIRSTMGGAEFEVLQASVETDDHCAQEFHLDDSQSTIVRVVRGDHAGELAQICSALKDASSYTANELQKEFLDQYISSLKTGSLDTYRDSQRTWIKDKGPRVENIFGFVEPYRDPFGVRAEFEGLVAISDLEETKTLSLLVENSDKFIRRLPWVDRISTENDGKGPFEKALFDPPDFTSIHALAYCSSIIFPGINLPNYNDIRQECGFKNVIIANRMSAESSKASETPFIDPSEAATFQEHKYPTYFWWVVLHELLGHGTGRMMIEDEKNKFNFDIINPPTDPLTKKPIDSWYKPGQTWTGQFGDLATTVDECRAELVGAYLMDDFELLELFGFTRGGAIEPEDITYNMYLQLGVDGLRGLADFNIDDGKWGQAHSRAHFATLKCLLLDGDGFMRIEFDASKEKLIVHVDRSRIVSHGKPALGRMLLKLHTYRCTAGVEACRSYYEDLSKVDGEYLEWRKVVLAKSQSKWVFSQANTFLYGDEVVLNEYPPTPEGVIQSWAERGV